MRLMDTTYVTVQSSSHQSLLQLHVAIFRSVRRATASSFLGGVEGMNADYCDR